MAERLGFLERLKRHHMFQVASAYATVAYVIILVANAVFPDIGLTRGQVRYVIAALALGFPLALVFGWLFIRPTQANPEWHSRWQRIRWRIAPIVAGPAVVFVAVSGIYLWHLNDRLGDSGAEPGTSAAQIVAVLPFGHSGAIDDAFMVGLTDSIDTELSIAGVRLVSGTASPVLSDPKSSIADISKATGATLVLKGSVQRADAKSDYQAYFELISAADGVTLDSRKISWSAQADPSDVQKSIASTVAGRAHFLSILDHYFARGYPTTKDTGALQFFRRGMLNYMNADYVHGIEMLRAAVKLDPSFAQAHAYIAYFEAANPDPGLPDPKAIVDQEIAAAESKVPGLPEAALARASRAFYLEDDPDAAMRTVKPVAEALADSYNVHMLQGFILRQTGHWQEALREFQAAAALDPYSRQVTNHIAKLGLSLRNYDNTQKYLDIERERWPLSAQFYLGLAQVIFSEDGDLDKFARVTAGDFDKFGVGPAWPPLALDRLEVAHFQGKHAEVIRGLKALSLPEPGGCPDPYNFPQLSVANLCVDPFMVESLRLSGKDQEAAAFAKLRAPELARLRKGEISSPYYTVNLALLQAFGGDASALKTLEPVLKSLEKPVAQWTEYDGIYSLDAAVALAWCGEPQQAVDLLAKSLDAPFGAHAALVAIDPVWRPLYKTPAFTALLASHGVTLARAP